MLPELVLENSASGGSKEPLGFEEPIFVTRPTLPDLNDFHAELEGIWERRWLTNNGPLHENLEAALRQHLGLEHLSLFCNGTIALLVALQAMRINSGEVITTPFTYPPSTHVLHWNQVKPVFCDIDPRTFNLDPSKIEALITPQTQAILPVHVYGNPCDVEAIQEIAERHGLRVIYDAAQAFGTKYRGRSLLEWGDLSTVSFHATKIFSTIEGGAIVASSAAQKSRIDFLKNFGIADEETVIGPGINGKMNEIQAAYGLLRLQKIDEEFAHREQIYRIYRQELGGVGGLTLPEDLPDTESNRAYFAVLVDPERFGQSRNDLYDGLKRFNVHTRKYFYPLCTHYPCYSGIPSARPELLPIAERVASQVLCLPIYGTLELEDVRHICQIIRHLKGKRA